MELLQTKYKDNISGVISCFDRLIFTGTMPTICYSQGMTGYLYSQNIRIFDYPKFAEQFRDKIRTNAEELAKQSNIEIEFIQKSTIRKEAIVKKKLEIRGNHTGLVCILSAMESCSSYRPWHNKQTGKTYVKGTQSKCLHYYFYFIDEFLGFGYIRVPTWLPMRTQVYVNGHDILARKLDKEGISYTTVDNAFDSIDDFEKAQELSDKVEVDLIHQRLELLSKKYCPIHYNFNNTYHWSIMQAEYATDIIFKKQEDLQAIYSDLIATAIHTVNPENIFTFFGKKLDPRFKGEAGNNYNVRIQGSRVKHSIGKNSIKMYDKFSKILRIETTTNDVTFFKHYRKVEHKNGTTSMKNAPLKKNIYSLNDLSGLLKASNKRYIEFISAIENKEVGRKRLEKVTSSKKENERNYKGFNFFDKNDIEMLLAILKGEFNISGFRNKDIRQILPNFNASKISRLFKRMRVHGLIKSVGKTYKYYITKLGKEVILQAEKIKKLVLIPALNY